MKQSIRIRTTGIRITEVLDLLAEGNSPDQIMKRQPKLTMTDILAAIAFARDIVTNYVTADDEINIGGFITIHAKSSRVVDVTKVRDVKAADTEALLSFVDKLEARYTQPPTSAQEVDPFA